VRWLVTASGRGWGLRGCRQDGGGQGSCLHRSGSDCAVGGPACSALCSHVRPMLLGAGLSGAGRAHFSGGVRGPGSGGYGWRALGRAQCLRERGEGAAASRPALQGFRRARRQRVGVRGGGSGVGGRMLAGRG